MKNIILVTTKNKTSNLGHDVLIFSKMGLTVYATIDFSFQINDKNPSHLDCNYKYLSLFDELDN